MKNVSFRLRVVYAYWLLAFPMAVFAEAQSSSRIFGNANVVEACELAERTGVPLCIALIDRSPNGGDLPGLEAFWKKTMDQLSTQCVVLNIDHSQRGDWPFLSLRMRTSSASLDLEYTGMILIDPWQEKLLAGAKLNYFDLNDPRKKSGMLEGFRESTEKLLQTAVAWNAANGPKPETWTDTNGRAMIATAVGWDATTATFKLAGGKITKVKLETLADDGRKRLRAAFAPALPMVDADDAGELEKYIDQEVVVICRERSFRSKPAIIKLPVDPPDWMEAWPISSQVRIHLKNSDHEAIRKNHPEPGIVNIIGVLRGRVKGLLRKDATNGAPTPFFMEITEHRQVGGGYRR